MEHFALRLVQPTVPTPPGLRVIVLRDEDAADGSTRLVHEILPVVGLQPQIIHHYASDDPRAVHPDPTLMEKLGWRYRHQECRYAPVCITSTGRVEALNPDEPTWSLLPADTPLDRAEQLAEHLKEEERIRRAIELRIEDQDQGNLESD